MYSTTKIVLFIVLIFTLKEATAQQNFIKRRQNHFMLNNQPYHFIGTNMWYANLLALPDDEGGDRKRLTKELDFLQKQGVRNIRVLAGAQGDHKMINAVMPVHPALQTAPGEYNTNLMKGMDFLLQQLQKRKMTAVFFLSNNWEWSGGFLQYLNWYGKIDDSTLAKKYTWDENRDLTSRFYDCKECKEDYWAFVKMILHRTNTLTGKKYINEPAIMSWEIANEPRPMRPYAINSYKDFLKSTSALIKAIDNNHLLTIGTEGYMGTENMQVFTEIHTDVNIDYATIHIWPKNWGWYKDESFKKDFDTVLNRTERYITEHDKVMTQINKPFVIEEFGMPRDELSFSPRSAVTYRDKYYGLVLQQLLKSKRSKTAIAGINFWAFGGFGVAAKNETAFWKEGDDLLGDPPMEEQGLNSVFASDSSSWRLIKKYKQLLN